MKIDATFFHNKALLRDVENAIKEFPVEDKSAVLDYLINDNDTFYKLVSCVGHVKHLTTIFCGKSLKHLENENKIFQKLLADKTGFTNLFDSLFSFLTLYKHFIHNKLTTDQSEARSVSLFDVLANSQAIKQIAKNKSYITDMIHHIPERENQILTWAQNINLLTSEADVLSIKETLMRETLAAKEAKQNAIKKQEVITAAKKSLFWQFESSNLPPLFRLAKSPYQNSTDEAIELLQQGFDCESRDSKGRTPLITACRVGNTWMTLTLIEWGAKVNVRDNENYMPKQFKLNYDCDHDYDDGGCIPLKRLMHKPMRNLLNELMKLEAKHLNANGLYHFDQIKEDLLKFVNHEDFQQTSPLKAICGYIANNVKEEEKEAVFQFFKENVKHKIDRGSVLLRSQLPSKKSNLSL